MKCHSFSVCEQVRRIQRWIFIYLANKRDTHYRLFALLVLHTRWEVCQRSLVSVVMPLVVRVTISECSWVPLLTPQKRPRHRYGGGRIANCAEPAWNCRSACAEYSGQKLLPVVVRRLWNQIDRARVVTETEKHGIHVPFFFLLVVIMGPVNLFNKFCFLNWPYMRWSAIRGQFNTVFCASSMARSRLLF